MTRSVLPLAALLSALLAALACGPPPATVVTPPLARPAPRASASAATPRPPPYNGEAGSCVLDGLAMPLYTKQDPRWGSVTAPLAIVLFSDFECPFCGQQRHALDEIKSRFGPEKLQIIWKNMPLRMHPAARPTAEAAQAVFEMAGSEAFWRFHDLAFSHRKALTEENFAAWAAQSGVPVEQWSARRALPSVGAKIDEDMRLAQAIGLRATPFMIINGAPAEGAVEAQPLIAFLDEELRAAASYGPHHACDRMRDGWAPER